MSKAVSRTQTAAAPVFYYKSTFALTFAIEIVGPDVWQWQECKDEIYELGHCEQGFKIQYHLYNGQSFEIDVAIWQNAAKVFCGPEYCWVRVWQFLERRWLTFSVRHAFPVKVAELLRFEATITPSFGSTALGAKGDKVTEVIFPPLAFGERRYFARVIEDVLTEHQKITNFIKELIWNAVEGFIPKSFLDGKFDVPTVVTDVRHQDTILYQIQEVTLNRNVANDDEEDSVNEAILQQRKTSKEQKHVKEKDKKKGGGGDQKNKFGLKLSGHGILAGTGRIVAFESFGERPSDMGEIIVIIGSADLPAQDDIPIAFVNVDNLFNAPLEEMRKLRITHLYTRWSLGPEVHNSEPIDIRPKKLKDVKFNDHYCLPMEVNKATEVVAEYLDTHYEIQLRAIKDPEPLVENAMLYGYDKRDREYGNVTAPKVDEEVDFVIATTRIDARSLSRGINVFLQGEYPLYPPTLRVTPLGRDIKCTNDINLIGALMRPRLLVPTSVVLAAQMTLEVSMGIAGCKPPRLTSSFSRLYFLSTDAESVMAILLKVGEINEFLVRRDDRDEMLTGFSMDTGDVTCFFLEGPRDKHILKIWALTEEYYPKVKPVFSSSARYSYRIYGEMLQSVPFTCLKMYVPLQVLLSCPAVYARPALPVPARIAALKFGRLLQQSFRVSPATTELPTLDELRSFRLELCSPPRTYPFLPQTDPSVSESQADNKHEQGSRNINWR